jgi:hypothetical protein
MSRGRKALQRKTSQERHALGKGRGKIHLAGDGARRDRDDLFGDTGQRRDFVHDLVLDQGCVHVGGEQALAPKIAVLDRDVDRRPLERGAGGGFGRLRRQAAKGQIASNARSQKIRGPRFGARLG